MNDVFRRLGSALGDRYHLEREIGAGGMATVYLARDIRHRRRVALKIVRPDLGSPLSLERFLREIELAARLQHPHILPVFDSGVLDIGAADPVPYFVMPYVEGENLRHRLHREGRLSLESAVSIAGEVADALAYAHGQGVIHRDIKPENILLSGGHPVVADFGVAKALESEQGPWNLTGFGFAVGTPHYMSPEQATGRDAVDARADQYSLACVLYEMLTGKQPFTGETAQSIVAQAMTAPRPRPSRAAAGVPGTLDQVVVKAMAAEPRGRFGDMTEFASALREPRAHAGPASFRWSRIAGAAALIAAVGVGWVAMRPARAVAPAAAETIAVLPFSATGPGVEFLGEGMVDLLATNFDGVGGIRTVDPRAAVRHWQVAGMAPGDRLSHALQVGRDLGAGSVVMGSAVSAGTRVRLAADVYSTSGTALGREQVEGPADSVLALVDRLSLALLRDVWRSRDPIPSLDLASLTTDSLAALRAFLQGEQYYRRLAFDSALVEYTRATEVDSTFALAHLRRAIAMGWDGIFGSSEAQAAVDAGWRFADRLPPRDRRVLQVQRLYQRGKPAALDSARAFLGDYPNDLDGWFLLGETSLHTQEFTGASPDSIIAAFDSVLRRDSALVPAVIHPLETSMRLDDRVRYNRYLPIFERAAPRDQIEATHVAAAMLWGPMPPDSAIAAAMENYSGPLRAAFYAAYGRESATSDTIAALAAKLRPHGRRTGPHEVAMLGLGADILAGLGRLSEARLLADSLAAIAPQESGRALKWPVVLGATPGPAVSARIDSALRVLPPGPEADYARTIVALSRGQVAEVRRRAKDDSTTGLYPGLLAAANGWGDILAGDSTTGLQRMGAGLEKAASPGTHGATAFLRFQYAIALSARADSRAEGSRRLRYGFGMEPLLRPLSYLELGRAYEAAGDRDSAAGAYTRFLRLWDKADPGLQAKVTEAREGLRRLAAEPIP
ncbi:MAG: protein kinase [Gemmatimonadales bacterium]